MYQLKNFKSRSVEKIWNGFITMERPKSGRMEINMKNIIICIPSLEYGGAERVTVRLAKEFSKKYNVTIITMHSAVNEYSLDKK